MLYWTLVLYTPFFALCGIYAFLNILFAPTLPHQRTKRRHEELHLLHAYPHQARSSRVQRSEAGTNGLTDGGHYASAPLSNGPAPSTPAAYRVTPPLVNPRRTRAAYALIMLLLFIFSGVVSAVVGSAVLGYILVGLFQAGQFNMST